MKRCPKCNRTFPDMNQKFCTVDGGFLVAAEPAFDPNATIQSSSATFAAQAAQEKPTSRPLPDLNETIAASAPTVVLPRQTGPTGLPTSAELPPPPHSQTAPLPPGPAAPAQPKSKLPMILGILLLLVVLIVGAVVALFFMLVKPRLDARQSDRPTVASTEQTNENVNTNSNTSANTEQPKTESEFVAPPDTAKFTNSQANLDGKLAEHYFDFSFYYPKAWTADPKAGVPGANNFAKVERMLPPDFTQENFAVGWYTSKGTFEADKPTFPQLVEILGSSLAKGFPDYRKVSEGPTKVNSLDGYEFRFVSVSKGTEKGDIQLWGRVVFLPPGTQGEQTGATLIMLATSLAPELNGIDDVGAKGEMPVILESFRFGKNR
jgi:hypothetical protein